MTPLETLLILWGIVTGLLAVVLMYRSIIAMKEEEQLFLTGGNSNSEEEQKDIQKRLRRLAPYTKLLSASSGILLIASAGMWLAQAMAGR
jgi:hypothetical protein